MNIIDGEIAALRAELEQAKRHIHEYENTIAELDVICECVNQVLDGKAINDFAESFPLVSKAIDVIRYRDAHCHEQLKPVLAERDATMAREAVLREMLSLVLRQCSIGDPMHDGMRLRPRMESALAQSSPRAEAMLVVIEAARHLVRILALKPCIGMLGTHRNAKCLPCALATLDGTREGGK
jgi:hypothetical protein